MATPSLPVHRNTLRRLALAAMPRDNNLDACISTLTCLCGSRYTWSGPSVDGTLSAFLDGHARHVLYAEVVA